MKPFVEEAKRYISHYGQGMLRYASWLSVPLILLALMVLLGFVHIFIPGVLDLNLAFISTVALLIYYARLQWRLTLALLPILFLLLWIATFFSEDGPTALGLWAVAIFFLLGVLLLGISAFIDGNTISWREKSALLIMAPLCLVAELIFMTKRMQALKETLYGTCEKPAASEKNPL